MTPSAGWEGAVALVENMLEAAGRLLDGDPTAIVPDLTDLDLTSVPDPSTRARLELLLADMDEAMTALDHQMAEVSDALAQADRLRLAGREYLRF